jgi:large subunit ribosomal protein L3
MCKGLIGKKLGMTGVFANDGTYVPVTVVKLGPCVVTQIKTVANDGYNSLQVGFGEKKAKNITNPLKGHFKKSGGGAFEVIREVDVEDPENYQLGQVITPEIFAIGEKVDVVGKTKGRGFSGVIKRHGFAGGRMSHGGDCKRIPGSIGASAWPSRVIKGKKMPGQYGDTRKTVRNMEIVDIRADENLVLIKGPLPGSRSGLVMVKKVKFSK